MELTMAGKIATKLREVNSHRHHLYSTFFSQRAKRSSLAHYILDYLIKKKSKINANQKQKN